MLSQGPISPPVLRIVNGMRLAQWTVNLFTLVQKYTLWLYKIFASHESIGTNERAISPMDQSEWHPLYSYGIFVKFVIENCTKHLHVDA